MTHTCTCVYMPYVHVLTVHTRYTHILVRDMLYTYTCAYKDRASTAQIGCMCMCIYDMCTLAYTHENMYT